MGELHVGFLTQLYPMSLKILEDIKFRGLKPRMCFKAIHESQKCPLPPCRNVQVVIHLPGLTTSSESDFLCFSS